MNVRTLAVYAILISICSVWDEGRLGKNAFAAPSMSEVMNECERVTPNFIEYVQCVKNIYDAEGAKPDDPSVRWFYYQLDEISERVVKKEISQAKAMAEVYKAYTESISSNKRHRR